MLYLQRKFTLTVLPLILFPVFSYAFLCHLGRTPIRTALFSTTLDEAGIDVHDLQAELIKEDLALCHGILHAVGIRELKDLINLTKEQIVDLGLDTFDRQNIFRVKDKLNKSSSFASNYYHAQRKLISTQRYGAFDRRVLPRFEVEEKQDFSMETICSDNEVYKGVLFNVEQCKQLNRMSEHYAYRRIGVINGGWSDQIYTLTAQHMACKDVPGMVPSIRIIMRQLIQELYTLYPQIISGTIRFETDTEPHLVKYDGKAKGTPVHTDNSKFKYITVNVMLSAQDEYTGGGTHITKLDETIRLHQGEMLIHLGDLAHAGVAIRSGVRRLLIAFLACEWKDEELNRPTLENAR
eukprot:CAMPEP_0183292244 /NCGR_PEP_ID=MMETSP0160_2-20130417/1366_1 /TAXON_ID=2839 ORGANISM="Odontella Sinensis, Strain Grunow 1884" /NCGR_SAMPLE_ID=MMETSP0160_2 /ASSEMBLY_ACC=CAM_ASM_000250 /LENGTH=350 /DNA_ID=CAMNT_0025453165 /DNA_START=52 /DNA_END=1104 /DNA_ORIENTATION=+